jgi:hypothetical protein
VYYIEKNTKWKGDKAVINTAANLMWKEKYKPLWKSKRYTSEPNNTDPKIRLNLKEVSDCSKDIETAVPLLHPLGWKIR